MSSNMILQIQYRRTISPNNSMIVKGIIGFALLALIGLITGIPFVIISNKATHRSTESITEMSTTTTIVTTMTYIIQSTTDASYNSSISTTTISPVTVTYDYPSNINMLNPGQSLLWINNPSNISKWYRVKWLYTVRAVNTTIAFGIQNDPSFTLIDDISVRDGTTDLLLNGGFESGNLSPGWTGGDTVKYAVGVSHSGYYCYADGTVGHLNWLYQSFATIPGHVLYISFWISWFGSGVGVVTNVTIFP